MKRFSDSEYYSPLKTYDMYPSWAPPEAVPITKEDIEAVFIQLGDVFGFQYDNIKNTFDYFLKMLDSRASRMGPNKALRTVHADYIGGINANFRKWYFASQLDIDDTIGFNNIKKNGKTKSNEPLHTISQAEEKWSLNMNNSDPSDCVIQVALYLLCWGEANNIRFMPECLCFIFKCCNDYYYSLDNNTPIPKFNKSFLDHVITPLYKFYRDQCYQLVNGTYVHTDKDHKDIIGYDDMNQLFWHSKGLQRIVLEDKTKLFQLEPKSRYLYLDKIVWKKVFSKSFKEQRSWSHVFCNFSRIWTIHVSTFWYYTSYNAPTLYTWQYQQLLDNKPTLQARFTVMALSGGIACLITLFSVIFEASFIPRKVPGAVPLVKRVIMLILLLIINVSPSIYFLGFNSLNQQSLYGLLITLTQFLVSLGTVIYLSVVPLTYLFCPYDRRDRNYSPNETFNLSYFKLKGTQRAASYGLWLSVFLFKFIESYFYLTLSLKDPIRELSMMKLTRCAGDRWLGQTTCSYHTMIVLILIIFIDLVLFFLDTYLWYIICNTIFSVFRSFYIGVSIWTPWRNIFSRLPKRIFSKIISVPGDGNIKAKYLVSQVWNSIIISMYREHLLSIEHVQKLIYKKVMTNGTEGNSILKEPTFFVSQEDMTMKSTLFYNDSEAQRRITFFAQSLSTPMRDIGPTESMPSFTVLIPHYKEKITLSLREIIKEEDQYSNITMLEYLKKLHPLEWSCFVRDSRLLAEEFDADSSGSSANIEKGDDFPYHSVGYKVETPEYVLRTRIWASLRTQTLYRTISGFMNYSRAIKLLYDIENPTEEYTNDYEKLQEASAMALRKFRVLVSMQRYKYFSTEERENTEFLLRAYPELQICYLDEEIDPETGEIEYFSVLIDGNCPIMDNNERAPKYKIKLSGNPILGDGKSDNQNHAIIFTRGEYIQLVDANQDNYIEECLKIRSVLAEFDEYSPPIDPYALDLKDKDHAHPVAIIGTREYIFSENIGILGDIAAGKEQTFGTLFARTLAHIGGKLHYGHPDFLNGIFMTTRGGVSKAQRGLHLNEDVYAGINAIARGGRIKHCEYIQCGKGRDLGFGSILNFTTKIGAGMGEQMLSREHFNLSTTLPIDRFLSYYYAHAGFHLNNAFIVLSIQLFLIVSINIAALVNESTICEYDKNKPITDPRRPVGCYNLIPVVKWLERSILSIFIVFAISFLPLFIQELVEKGAYKSFTRLAKHMASLSPLFEVFVCRVYAESLISDMYLGGAKYISTGRGFATIRVPMSILYSRFAPASLYFGAMSGLLVFYASVTMWKIPLVYFWITVTGLLICPFLYNPNQFNFNDFFLDYRNYLKWLSSGNTCSSTCSWIGYTRSTRSRFTGVKLYGNYDDDDKLNYLYHVRPSRFNTVISSSIMELIGIGFIATAYLFSNALNDTRMGVATPGLMRLLIVTFGPVVVNMTIVLVFFIISCVFGPIISLAFKHFPSGLAIVAHSLSVINYVIFFELLWFLQNWDISRTILGFALSISIQSWFLRTLICCIVSKEFKHDKTNKAWWSGKWATAGLGWHLFFQPLREFICKVAEMSYFVADVVIGHIILFVQFPLLFIPYIDKWHMLMLLWLKPNSQLRPRLLNKKQRRKVRITVQLYFLIFVIILALFSMIFVVPMVAKHVFEIDMEEFFPIFLTDLVQVLPLNSSKKGLHKGLIKNYN